MHSILIEKNTCGMKRKGINGTMACVAKTIQVIDFSWLENKLKRRRQKNHEWVESQQHLKA